jgi:hypothetical protein
MEWLLQWLKNDIERIYLKQWIKFLRTMMSRREIKDLGRSQSQLVLVKREV